MNIAYIMTPNGITVLQNGKSNTIQKEDDNYEKVKEAIKNTDWELVEKLINKEEAIRMFTKGEITVKNGQVFFQDEEVHGYVVNKILQFINEDIDASPLLNFLEKIMSNPSKRCVDQLFTFLEHKNMPIDPDGDFYAYKAVRHDWTDKYTGTINNSVGTTIEVTRNKVDDEPQNACSYGLHAGSIQYVTNFKREEAEDKVIIVKINPKDVVSVPEYDTSKLRCCRYEVVAEYEGILPDTTYDYDEEETLGEYCDDCGARMDLCECSFREADNDDYEYQDDDDDEYDGSECNCLACKASRE